MKSTFVWAGLNCWETWVLQSHPVLRLHFITAAVRWAQSRNAVKVFYYAGAGVNTWNTLSQNFIAIFMIPFLLFWNLRYTVELKSMVAGTDLQCRSSRKKHIKEADHPTAACPITSLMQFKQQAGMCQMAA